MQQCNSSTILYNWKVQLFSYPWYLNGSTFAYLETVHFVIIKQYLYDVLSNYLETTAYYSDVSLFCFALLLDYIAVKRWYARSYGNWYRFLKFFIFCARGGLQRISPSSICTYSLPYPTPSKYISSIKNPIPSGQPPCQPLPAGCYSEPGQDRQATYHIHASTQARMQAYKRISV